MLIQKANVEAIRFSRVPRHITGPYNAKAASMMPMRPAAEALICILLAAPACEVEAAEPDAVEEEEPEPEAEVEPEPEPEPVGAEPDEEPVAEASGLALPDAEPVSAAPEVAVPVAVKKRELMQPCWHLAYASVSAGVPEPWGHLAAHSVVLFAMAALGAGTPTQPAWQLRSLWQAAMQLAVGEREVVEVEDATPVSVVEPGTAATRATRPEKARAVKNFMLTTCVVLFLFGHQQIEIRSRRGNSQLIITKCRCCC